MEKIDETRPLRWPDSDLRPLWPKLGIRTAHDDIDANHKNSRDRNDQSRCRSGQSVCDPAERSSRHRGPLPKWHDRSVVLAAGTQGRGIHTERHGSRCRPRHARKATTGTGPPHELRTDSDWPAQSASSVAGHESKPLTWRSVV